MLLSGRLFPSSFLTVLVLLFSNHIFHFIIFLKKQLLFSGCKESGVSGDCVIDLVVFLKMPWMCPLKSINRRKLWHGSVNPGVHVYLECLSYFWAMPLWWLFLGWFKNPEPLVYMCLVNLLSLIWMQKHQIYSLLYSASLTNLYMWTENRENDNYLQILTHPHLCGLNADFVDCGCVCFSEFVCY